MKKSTVTMGTGQVGAAVVALRIEEMQLSRGRIAKVEVTGPLAIKVTIEADNDRDLMVASTEFTVLAEGDPGVNIVDKIHYS